MADMVCLDCMQKLCYLKLSMNYMTDHTQAYLYRLQLYTTQYIYIYQYHQSLDNVIRVRYCHADV